MNLDFFPHDALSWDHPVSIVLAGPSNSGKSTICFNFIRNRHELLRGEKNLKVRYHLPQGHRIEVPPDILNDRNVVFYEGIPDFNSVNEPCIIIIDDLAGEINKEVVECFTRYSHHRKITVMLCMHNIFHSDGLFRTISLNTGMYSF